MKSRIANKLLTKTERAVSTWLSRARSPRRDFQVLADDRVVVSYPRSGNTWTRFLVANLLSPDAKPTFTDVERLVPDIYKASRQLLEQTRRPRVLKSHEYFDPRYRRVIYIVRDPRDVAISYYHFHRKIRAVPDEYAFDAYLSRFLAGEMDPYGTWEENVISWLATRGRRPQFLMLRYEDMIERTLDAVVRIDGFLELGRSREQLESAVARSSASEMRSLEKHNEDWNVTKHTRKDIPFVRSAIAGAWREQLSSAQVERIEAAWGPLMKALGYECVSRAGRDAQPLPLGA